MSSKDAKKPYALKSSAVRAARQAGYIDGQYEVYSVPGRKKGEEDWAWRPTAARASMEAAFKEGNKPKPDPEEDALDAAVDTAVADVEKNGKPKPEVKQEVKEEPPAPPKPKTLEEIHKEDATLTQKPLEVRDLIENPLTEAEKEEQRREEKIATTVATVKEAARKHVAPRIILPDDKPRKDIRHKSEIASPTKTVWHIADELIEKNPNIRRKEIIEECSKRGIAYWTARTQVQQWFTARRNSTK